MNLIAVFGVFQEMGQYDHEVVREKGDGRSAGSIHSSGMTRIEEAEMCYSASASFAASGALAASSYVISRLPKKESEKPISLIPMIFAAHQFIEGVLWLNQTGICPDQYKSGAIYGYTFIAYALWPAFIPFVVYRLETEKVRRVIILLCLAIGLYASLASSFSILQNPVDVSVIDQSLSYSIRTPKLIMIPYFISVTIPFLISSDKRIVIFGGALTLSCVAAALMTASSTFPSVWCFYAAVLSIGLYLYFRASVKVHQPTHHRISWQGR